MIIYGDGTWQTHSDYPDTDFSGGEAAYIVPDGSELAAKIQSMPRVTAVTDTDGRLTDVQPPDTRAEDIRARLVRLDLSAVRPMRAVLAGTATDEDRARLADLERQAESLRKELAETEVK